MPLKCGRTFKIKSSLPSGSANNNYDDQDEVVLRTFYFVDIIMPLILTDINECEMFENVCEGGGLCVNTQGSFRCNCPPGLILDASGRRCIGKINQ